MVEKKALLIDGYISGCVLMERLISGLSTFTIKTASSGDKAIDLAQKEQFDFISLELYYETSILQFDSLVKLIRGCQPDAKIFIYTTVKSAAVLNRVLSLVYGISFKTDDERETKRLLRQLFDDKAGPFYSSACKKLLKNVENTPMFSPDISNPEHFVLKKIIEGQKDAEIAEEMARSQKTVEKHKATLRKKFNVTTTAALAAKAISLYYDKLQIG